MKKSKYFNNDKNQIVNEWNQTIRTRIITHLRISHRSFLHQCAFRPYNERRPRLKSSWNEGDERHEQSQGCCSRYWLLAAARSFERLADGQWRKTAALLAWLARFHWRYRCLARLLVSAVLERLLLNDGHY